MASSAFGLRIYFGFRASDFGLSAEHSMGFPAGLAQPGGLITSGIHFGMPEVLIVWRKRAPG